MSSALVYRKLPLRVSPLVITPAHIITNTTSPTASGVQLVEALCHKKRGSRFGSQYGPWKFSSDLLLLS